MPPTHPESPNPVFIVGVFRSGTSLLYSLLNQHPQIALMYECDVWDFPGRFARHRFNSEWLERQEFYNQALSRHRLILGDSLHGLENVRTPEDLYRIHGAGKGATLWGEKSPLYSVRLDQLARQYPHGSFILIWRDPVEIFRSVRVAGKKAPFFRRPGMLHRLIHHHEKLIRDAARLTAGGARVHHLNYDELVDRTEPACRGVCAFLGVAFEPEMLALKQADFTAVYRAPQHEFLRRGIIERQNFSAEPVTPAEAATLHRFRNRWERIGGRPLGANGPADRQTEPAGWEQWQHRLLGAGLFAGENLKRLTFEFLPLPWLRTYRQFKTWLLADNGGDKNTTMLGQLRHHGITILASFLLLAASAVLDYVTGPEVSVGPVYLIPCAALALVVGRGWATIAAVLAVLSITIFREGVQHHFNSLILGLVLWNIFMRFIFFEVFVLLLSRIRAEFRTPPLSHHGPA